MPQRITKDGLEHIPRIPRKKRPQHPNPLSIALIALACLFLPALLLLLLVFLAAHYPDQFYIACPLLFICLLIFPGLYFSFRQSR